MKTFAIVVTTGRARVNRKLVCFLPVILVFLATGAWANSVDVTMNFTVTGQSACGSGGTSVCVDTLNGSFIWDNTTNSVVGAPSVTITGPLNYGNLTVMGPVSAGSNNAIEATFTDPGGDYATFAIIFSGSSLTPGTYTFASGTPVAGTAEAVAGKCVSTTDGCSTYFTGSTFGGTVTVTSVAPTTVPEPGTLGLLGTGLAGIVGLFRRSFVS